MARPGFCRGGRRVGVRVTPWKMGTPHTQVSEEKGSPDTGHSSGGKRASRPGGRGGQGRLPTEAEGGGPRGPGVKRTGKLSALWMQT